MRLEKEFPCNLDSLSVMRYFFDNFAITSSLNPSLLAEIVLAVNEAVTNIIEHGGINKDTDHYTIIVELSNYELVVTITDPGKEYDPNHLRTAHSGTDIIKRRPRSGMGVYLIRQLVDGMIYNRIGSYNELKFIKKIS